MGDERAVPVRPAAGGAAGAVDRVAPSTSPPQAVPDGRLPPQALRRAQPGFRWEGVDCQPYKQADEAPFKDISRQVLFADPALDCELRYFEMAAGGWSTLERHEHAHAVMVARGRGHLLLNGAVRPVASGDLVRIDAWTWHQFRATRGESLGFLCMVNARRDKPELPDPATLAKLRTLPGVAAFLDGEAPPDDDRVDH